MELAAAVERAADRLGLKLDWEPPAVRVERAEWAVELEAVDLMSDDAPSGHQTDAAWLLLGVRLGLDKLIEDASNERGSSPLHFRRTALRRYHEAPSVHGEKLPLLIPSLTRRTIEEVSEMKVFHRPWLAPELEILIYQETGTKLDILTVEEQEESDEPDDERWRRVRAALFYNSYKVKPKQKTQAVGGMLHFFESTEGLGASRALLLPEFDYDAAQDGGFFSIPTRDRLIIARPGDAAEAASILPALRAENQRSLQQNVFALSDAVFQLTPDEAFLLEEPTFYCGEAADLIEERIIEVKPISQSGQGV